MTPPIRKLGEEIPPRLILGPGGHLTMADGGDPEKYLRAVRRKWIKEGRLGKGEPIAIAICDIKSMQRIEQDVLLLRSWGS